MLTIGFARRFATYKRATLLFKDLDWLRRDHRRSRSGRWCSCSRARRIRPTSPGQELIRAIARVARMPEFEGRSCSSRATTCTSRAGWSRGVDVWLNNPVYPLEASGTSGMKAGMNGVINLSVLDGWWDEGYDGEQRLGDQAGHRQQSTPQRRDREEARTLYEILQDHVCRSTTSAGPMGLLAEEWIRIAKRSIATLLPRFNSGRMVNEYVAKFYRRAAPQGRRYMRDGLEVAGAVADFKRRVRRAWPAVALRRVDAAAQRMSFGDRLTVEVGVNLGGLDPSEVAVELVLERLDGRTGRGERRQYALAPLADIHETGEHRYRIELAPELCGHLEYRLRAYPSHPDFTHPYEMGLMRWA